MIQYLDPLCLTPIDDTFDWYLDSKFSILDEVLGLIEIKALFRTDLGSVPRLFWNIVPPEGPATKGYVPHDWLYTTKLCTRAQADDFLLRSMAQEGVGYIERYTIYWALRAGGWTAWNSDAKTGPRFFTPPVIVSL